MLLGAGGGDNKPDVSLPWLMAVLVPELVIGLEKCSQIVLGASAN